MLCSQRIITKLLIQILCKNIGILLNMMSSKPLGVFFHSNYLLKAVNETLITLILKNNFPYEISHYRRIRLCNILYKMISKILVNRLIPYLNACICSRQTNFGQCYYGSWVHPFFEYKEVREKKGYMALKLDMSKAYD